MDYRGCMCARLLPGIRSGTAGSPGEDSLRRSLLYLSVLKTQLWHIADCTVVEPFGEGPFADSFVVLQDHSAVYFVESEDCCKCLCANMNLPNGLSISTSQAPSASSPQNNFSSWISPLRQALQALLQLEPSTLRWLIPTLTILIILAWLFLGSPTNMSPFAL